MSRPCNCNSPGCRLCHLANNDPRYQKLWGSKVISDERCIHLGQLTGETVSCPSCRGRVELKLFSCAKFGECTLVKAAPGKACCNGFKSPDGTIQPCLGYETKVEIPSSAPSKAPSVASKAIGVVEEVISPISRLKWAYGVTTVPSRRDNLLLLTLDSLRGGGFEKPRLFVDGAKGGDDWSNLDLEVTFRYPTIRTHGNWALSLSELFIREPTADRYAIFQDDFVTSKNLRAYLDTCAYPDKGYWNLYTFPSNQTLAPMEGQTGRQRHGWYLSNQFGRGAVALVFNRDAALALLTSQHFVERPLDPNRGWKAVDGGIVTAMTKAGYQEYVHNPSLVQHTGIVSAMGNKPHKLAESFRGEAFDCLEIFREKQREAGRGP